MTTLTTTALRRLRRAFAVFGLAAALFAAACPATASPVAVAFDDAGADAKFSRSRAVNVQRLLAAAGLESSLHPVSALAGGLAPDVSVLHVVWISRLPSASDKAVRAFVARGGKVVVHGSFSPELAGIMGLATPSIDYETPRPGASAWTGFELPAPRLLDAPERVDNRVAKVARTSSAAPGTRAIAFWRDEAGRRGPVALWRCDTGFWLVRPLYDDGPSAPRVRLVCAMTCALSPPLWKTSALALRKAAWSGRTRRELLRASPRRSRGRVEESLAEAERQDSAVAAAFGRGLYGAAHSNLWLLAAATSRAYAAAHPVRKPSRAILAAWEPTGFGGISGGWEDAAEAMRQAGVTDAFVWCGSLAGSVTDIPGVPAAGSRAGRPDPLPAALRACHARGIRVHAWFAALSFENAPPERRAAFVKAGRLLHRPDGSPLDWLDPANKANVSDIARALRSLASRGVDGVNLDFVRYPGPTVPAREKADPAKIGALVAALRGELRKVAPKARFSACVYGWYPDCISSCGQDWYDWIDRKLVDFAVPMNYAPDVETLRNIEARQKRRRSSIVCGIGAGSNEARLDAAGLLEQLSEAFRSGYGGAAVYPFDARFAEEFLPALKEALR